jgi:integrase
MASVNRQDGPRGPRWVVRYRKPDGGTTQKAFTRAKAAEDFAVEIEHAKRAGAYVDPTRAKMTFGEMAERWASLAAHHDTTASTREADLRLHVLPMIGKTPLVRLSPLELKALIRHLEGRLAPTTVARVWAWVVAILNAAVLDGRLAVSPAKGVRPRRGERAPLRLLEEDEVVAVVAEMPAHYRAPALLAARAGLRLGEAAGLTPFRVDWLSSKPLIRVERQLIQVPGRPPYIRLPKEDKTRVVPVGPAVMEPLAEHLATRGRARAWDEVDGVEAELVFASVRGEAEPIRRRRLDEAFSTAARRAGLPAGTHFHSLRHYYASTLIDAGASEREVGKRLGHSSAQVTAVYGDLFERADDRTRAAVEAAVARGQFQRNSNTVRSPQAVTITHSGHQDATIHTLTEGGKVPGQTP